ncbi:MAG: hypothetical protein QOK20_1653 [Acidimicrobiaceae bacterium]|nr:hypothetical protein [Acidimicrobiaceae bacterium]
MAQPVMRNAISEYEPLKSTLKSVDMRAFPPASVDDS